MLSEVTLYMYVKSNEILKQEFLVGICNCVIHMGIHTKNKTWLLDFTFQSIMYSGNETQILATTI